MSYLVLHMDKFKKEAVRGIQSHNQRERESHSNPDIDYDRSVGNYDLHESASVNYAEAIQNRIDDLLLVKAVRKDAVHMCGLLVTSDSAFFKNLSPEDTKRFFAESKAFLTEFVGEENVISAMVHMDEKTPHMHFLHVPVTQDGRLNANSIYTRASLKKLQTEFPVYLQSKGFDIERGVEQTPGSARKHLDTREFKQQQEALNKIKLESADGIRIIDKLIQREEDLKKNIEAYERQAEEAEKVLREETPLPQVSLFNYKSVSEKSAFIIAGLKKALAAKHIIEEQKERLQREVESLNQKLNRLNAEHTALKQQSMRDKQELESQMKKMKAIMAGYKEFLLQPEIHPQHRTFVERKQAEQIQRRHEAERQEQAERERQLQMERDAMSQSRGMRMR